MEEVRVEPAPILLLDLGRRRGRDLGGLLHHWGELHHVDESVVVGGERVHEVVDDVSDLEDWSPRSLFKIERVLRERQHRHLVVLALSVRRHSGDALTTRWSSLALDANSVHPLVVGQVEDRPVSFSLSVGWLDRDEVVAHNNTDGDVVRREVGHTTGQKLAERKRRRHPEVSQHIKKL